MIAIRTEKIISFYKSTGKIQFHLQISIFFKHLPSKYLNNLPTQKLTLKTWKKGKNIREHYYFHYLWKKETSSYFVIFQSNNHSGQAKLTGSFRAKSLKDTNIWIWKIYHSWSDCIHFLYIQNWLLFSVHWEVWEYFTKGL